MPAVDYATVWTAVYSSAHGPIGIGTCVIVDEDRELVVPATLANRQFHGRTQCSIGIAVTVADSANPQLRIQTVGPVGPEVTGLGPGEASVVRVSDSGMLERVASPGPSDVLAGRCDEDGYAYLNFSRSNEGPMGPTGVRGPQGVTGPQGEVGPQGPQGEVGPQGAKGETGARGATGVQGPQGVQGVQGTTGPQGATGVQGVQGAQGVTGATGPTGQRGATGPQGAAGPQGVTGAIGPVGPQGVTGPQGATGPRGATGVQGVTGATGPTGSRGATGPQGATGLQGGQGVQGAQGPTGPQGLQGVQGQPGPTGSQGANGRTIENGPGFPMTYPGGEGNFFINTDAWTIYGPKSFTDWGSPVSLIGPQGLQGAQGPTGPRGMTGAAGPLVANFTAAINGMRLTLVSGDAYPASDATAASTLYLTPAEHGLISFWDGSDWVLRSTGQVSKSLGTLTNGMQYDVYAYWTGSAVDLEYVAWSFGAPTSRGTRDGILVRSADPTRRYVGSFYTTSTTTTEDSRTMRLLYNHYNRRPRLLSVLAAASSWTYTTASWRVANANTSYRVFYLAGTANTLVHADAFGGAQSTSANVVFAVGIGVNSTSSSAAQFMGAATQAANGGAIRVTSAYRGYPGIGLNYVSWLEYGGTGITFLGHSGDTSRAQTGLMVELFD